MMRTIRRAVTIVAGAAALSLAAANGAGANDVGRMESAIQVNLSDIQDATLANSHQNGDGTCLNPVVVAGPLTVPANFVIGETYGNDAAQAYGHCLSYQGGNTPATLTVWLEYQPYPGAAFQPIPGCPSGTTGAPATVGVHALVSPVITCQYRLGDAAANRPHRAHAVLVYNGRTYHGYSAVWFGTTKGAEPVTTA